MDQKLLKKLQINGRYDLKNSNLYFYHAGSGVSFNIKSRIIRLNLEFENSNGFIYIIVDKNYENKKKILIDKENFIEYELDDFNEHQIDILKCNEEQDNVLILKDIQVDGKIFKSKNIYKYRIKVYGDSTIAGYGILKKENGSIKPSFVYNDGIEDFCFDSLYKLNAYVDSFSASGWGLSFSEYTNPKTIGIIDKYNKISLFNNKEWQDKNNYDLLIISVGTNDFSYVNSNKDNQSFLINKFVNDYIKLIEEERRKNVGIPVLMIYGTLKEENVYSLIERTYKEISKRFSNVFLHKFSGDNSAISNHAFVDHHKVMAKELTDVLKNIL